MQLPLKLTKLTNTKTQYIFFIFCRRNPSHNTLNRKISFSLKQSILHLELFLKKLQKNKNLCWLLHHSPSFLSSLQASNHHCKQETQHCFINLLPWQILSGASSRVVELKAFVHSSSWTLLHICFSCLRPKDHEFITVLQNKYP